MSVMSYIITTASASALGDAFKQNRRALGLTQQALADRTGCRRQTIADVEAGKNVGLHTLLALLAAMDKAVIIVSKRLDLDRLAEAFHES